MSSDGPILEVRQVTKRFGGVVAIDNCSLYFNEHQISGLIGPNGAGKSTLIDLITGFVKPDTGRIEFAGHDITGKRPDESAALGLVRTFQLSSEFANLSVMENMMAAIPGHPGGNLLNVFFRPHRVSEVERDGVTEARELLKRFQLYHLRDEYAKNLSGGQKRLLELARALMLKPKMLLLDEPMAGVNPALVDSLMEHLLDLHRQGMTIVIVEHEMAVIEHLCERVLMMNQGALLAHGSMEDVRGDERVIDAYLG